MTETLAPRHHPDCLYRHNPEKTPAVCYCAAWNLPGENAPVFVYGTLLRGEGNHGIIAGISVRVERASIAGTLLALSHGGFPAVVLNHPDRAGDVVHGELVWLDRPESIRRLDRLEGFRPESPETSHYRRVRVRAHYQREDLRLSRAFAGYRQTNAWVYVYDRAPADSRPIPSGDWRTVPKKF